MNPRIVDLVREIHHVTNLHNQLANRVATLELLHLDRRLDEATDLADRRHKELHQLAERVATLELQHLDLRLNEATHLAEMRLVETDRRLMDLAKEIAAISP